MEIIKKSVNSLIPYVNNTRTHSDEQVQQIASSIKEFGFTNPVLLDEHDGIIAGHGRIMAAKLLSLDEIPTITLKGLTDAQIKAYIIADNKLALNAGWDEELLKVEIEGLYGEGFDIDLLGFTLDELNDLDINLDGSDIDLDEDKADEVTEIEDNPVIKRGDIIELGHNFQHRVMCGDSTSEDDAKRLMDSKKADMVFTDPPYNVAIKGKFTGAIKNDDLSDEDFEKLLNGVSEMIKEYNKGSLYISYEIRNHTQFEQNFEKCGEITEIIIWNKDSASFYSNDKYNRKFEAILFIQGNGQLSCKAETNVWDYAKSSSFNSRDENGLQFNTKGSKLTIHPTVKPFKLVERALLNSSKIEDIILDTFGGSGSTLIACDITARTGYLMELDEKYAQVIVQRYCDYTSIDTIKINGEEVSWSEYKDNALAEMPSNS